MSRLTKRENGELYYRQGENYAWSKPINKGNVKYPTLSKLAHYEDLEEQGRLIELPCKVGDYVYEIANITWEGYDWKYPSYKNAFVRKTRFTIDRLSSIGRFLFLTQEEAEAKLKEMEGDE